MTDAVVTGALLAAPKKDASPSTQLIVDVARKHGVSPFRQMGEMLRLRYGRRKVSLQEYYNNQMYRPDFSASAKRAFVGRKANLDLNLSMVPRGFAAAGTEIIADKTLFSAIMAQLGLSTTHTQAIVSKHRGFGRVPTLRNAADLVHFLEHETVYPVFCKPESGSLSVGSVRLEAFDAATREVVALTGSRVGVDAFAEEVFAKYSNGFVIQSAIKQHPKLVNMIGDAVGCVRVVTVLRNETPEVLYTLWKIPSPNAMSDNYWQSGSMVAELEKQTGALVQCRRGGGPTQETLTTHPVTGVTFDGFTMPHWDQVIDLATRAHMVFPRFGVFGWDIAITADGPLIIECNDNPHHTLYQLVTGEGIRNAEFMPVFDDVARRAKRIEKNLREKAKARKDKKGFLRRFAPTRR